MNKNKVKKEKLQKRLKELEEAAPALRKEIKEHESKRRELTPIEKEVLKKAQEIISLLEPVSSMETSSLYKRRDLESTEAIIKKIKIDIRALENQ